MQKQIKKAAFISFSQAISDEILKESFIYQPRYFSDFLFAYYNTSVVKSSKFPFILTLADLIPVFKKGDKECKHNYPPVSILSNMSKIFEKVIFRQIPNYMKSFLSKFSVAFVMVLAHNIAFCLCLKNGNVR